MIIPSNLFKVTVDVLLKDILSICGIKEVSTCGNNAISKKRSALFEGVLIKESIDDENILDNIHN